MAVLHSNKSKSKTREIAPPTKRQAKRKGHAPQLAPQANYSIASTIALLLYRAPLIHSRTIDAKQL